MRIRLLFLFVCSSLWVTAQDLSFGKQILDTLTSPHFWGRGYTKEGMKKAADYLASAFNRYGLSPLNGNSFLQPYKHSVNTFPGKMKVSINGKQLKPGIDFIVSPESVGVSSKGILLPKDTALFINEKDRIIVSWVDKLTWSASQKDADYTSIDILRSAINDFPFNYEVEIDNKWIPDFEANNVVGMVKGTLRPDSFLVITAHYDHLGGMGADTYFPGANDNASGTSLLMNLAQYYAKNPAPYSIAFLLFGSEEIGILGSKYFTENPLIPLKNIRFLLNTDLAGTGDEGITVVNATEFPKEFELLQSINAQHQLLKQINARGKAKNSDHYYFTEKGVPSFFFYTQGGISAYHDVHDRAGTLPLNEHEDLFKLVTEFIKNLSGNK